jgi:undecaprenyl-diphosphatase
VSVLLIVVALSVLTGVLAGLVIRRWPYADPASEATKDVGRRLGERARIARFLRSRLDPKVATGLALTVAMLAVVLAGTIAGVVVYMVRTKTGVVNLDLRIARWAAVRVSGTSDRVMDDVTWFGSTPVIVVAAVAGAVYGIVRWQTARVFWFLLLVVGGQFAVMNLVKALVERTRPDIHRLAAVSGSSFPSGHSMAAAATFAALALVVGRTRSPRTHAVLAGVAVAIAVAVACSRVLLGVHWFSDAVGGLALGWAWFAVCSVAFGGRLLRFGAPAAIAAGKAPSGASQPLDAAERSSA